MDATLILFGKDGHRKDISLKSGMNVVGRRPDCDIRIPLAIVSRKHCRISQNDSGLVIQDLGSANGTFVNRRQITEAEIKAGDLIQVGPMKFIIQIDGIPQNIMPPEKTGSSDSAYDSAINEMSGSHIGPRRHPIDDSLADLAPTADVDLDDSFT